MTTTQTHRNGRQLTWRRFQALEQFLFPGISAIISKVGAGGSLHDLKILLRTASVHAPCSGECRVPHPARPLQDLVATRNKYAVELRLRHLQHSTDFELLITPIIKLHI